MSEILLTPRPEPISPIDPDIRHLARAPSQSTEFFNAVFVDPRSGGRGSVAGGGGGGTRPLRVMKKKPYTSNERSSTVSVPSSPVSMRSTEHHPHQSISKLFMTLDLDRNPSITSGPITSEPTPGVPKPIPAESKSVSIDLTPPVLDLNKSTPLTPPWTPTSNCRNHSTTVIYPIKSQTTTSTQHKARSPVTPVTPSRAPAKALKLLGTGTHGPPVPVQSRRKRNQFHQFHQFRGLPEIERFFTTSSEPKPSTTITQASKSRKGRSPTFPKMRSVSNGTIPDRHHAKNASRDEWLDSDNEEMGWLMSDPSVRGVRSDIGRYVSDEDDGEEDHGLRAISVARPVQKGQKRVDESFVDLFSTDEPRSRSRPKAKTKVNAKAMGGSINRDPVPQLPKPPHPHPWSAAALASSFDSPPALIHRRHPSGSCDVSCSSSGSSSGPPSPASDIVQTPPKRPKKRPPPLILDMTKSSKLPIIILNSPPAHTIRSKKPLTPIRNAVQSSSSTVGKSNGTSRESTMSHIGARTPFVHPRRAPRPTLSPSVPIPMPVLGPKPRALDLTKASLPRTTDTRMPLLPPFQMTPEDEYPISVFEPVTPTDVGYPGGFGLRRGGAGVGDRKGGGGWLKKVVRDFGHVKT